MRCLSKINIYYKILFVFALIFIGSIYFSNHTYASSNIVQSKPASVKRIIDPVGSVDISYMLPYEPSRAVDGDKTNPTSRWQTRQGVGETYLQVNLGGIYSIDRWVVYHQGYLWNVQPNDFYNLKAYRLQKSNDGINFTDVDVVYNNFSNKTDKTVQKFTARYLRVYINQGGGYTADNSWNSILEFEAYGEPVSLPTVTTSDATEVTTSKAILNGQVVSDGSSNITERGFVYSIVDNPAIGLANVNALVCEGTTGNLSKEISTGLLPNTTYYFRSYAKNELGIGYGEVKTFTTLGSSLSIISDNINEMNLNGAEIIVNLDGETFKDNILDASNYSIINMPVGMSITSVNYKSNTSAGIIIGYDVTDFDSDINNLKVTIDSSELTNGVDMTSTNEFALIAVNDDESITIINPSPIVEGQEDGKSIKVDIVGGTFAPVLNLSNWSVTNIPTGVSAGDIIRDTNKSARIILSGNATVDYDTDITDVEITCDNTQFVDATLSQGVTANQGVVFTAIVEGNPPTGELIFDMSVPVPDATVDTLYQGYVFSVTGGTQPLTFNITDGELPLGMTLSSDGVISGTPEEIGDFTVTVTVTDSGNPALSKSEFFNITVLDKQTIEVVDIEIKSQPRLVYTEGDKLDLRNLIVTLIKSDLSSVDVGYSDFGANNIICDMNHGKTLELNDDNKSILVSHTVSSKSVETQNISVSEKISPLILDDTVTLPEGTVGEKYIGYGFVATGGKGIKEFTLESGNLPSGITLSDDGTLSGVPTEAGVKSFTISVTDSDLPPTTTSGAFSIVINEAPIINPITVINIEVKRQPKLIYTEGDSLNLDGLTVTLYKSDGSTQDVNYGMFYSFGIETNMDNNSKLSMNDNASVIRVKHIDSKLICYTQSLTINKLLPSNNGNNDNSSNTKNQEAREKNQVKKGTQEKNIVKIDNIKDSIEKQLSNGSNELDISTALAEFSFDKATMDWLSTEGKKDLELSVTMVDRDTLSPDLIAIVGDRPIYDFELLVDNESASKFGGNVRVSIPYTLKPGEDSRGIVVYYINNNGELEVIRNCYFDEKNNIVTFITDHFSKYMIGYNKVSFNDINGDSWYKNAVNFVSARGILPKNINGSYEPNVNINRAEFLAMLMKAYDIEPDYTLIGNFSDSIENPYSEYLLAAKKLKITVGVGNNKFEPEREISREEMFTLLYNTLDNLGNLPKEKIDRGISEFDDYAQISPWAHNTMNHFIKAGIINGTDNNKLLPKDKTSRAQMAQIIYNLISSK